MFSPAISDTNFIVLERTSISSSTVRFGNASTAFLGRGMSSSILGTTTI